MVENFTSLNVWSFILVRSIGGDINGAGRSVEERAYSSTFIVYSREIVAEICVKILDYIYILWVVYTPSTQGLFVLYCAGSEFCTYRLTHFTQ